MVRRAGSSCRTHALDLTLRCGRDGLESPVSSMPLPWSPFSLFKRRRTSKVKHCCVSAWQSRPCSVSLWTVHCQGLLCHFGTWAWNAKPSIFQQPTRNGWWYISLLLCLPKGMTSWYLPQHGERTSECAGKDRGMD
ncbi:hypothetical protein ARMSODRAFT_164737 [Armillaria solidipes]|uniref:Uncharacterized protein n=1 Tax=Armillaria solidipes TaxID=1076256 RepID=A0A2H3BKQ0_9AGAR|nr:hypothetical protein ARMSODRAFT_164737 [Armillaria solidipes]